jgi:hypothetical protein
LSNIGPSGTVDIELSGVSDGLTGTYVAYIMGSDMSLGNSSVINPRFINGINWGSDDPELDFLAGSSKIYRPTHMISGIDDYYSISGINLEYQNIIDSGQFTIQRVSGIQDTDGNSTYRLVVCDELDSNYYIGILYNHNDGRLHDTVYLPLYGNGNILRIRDSSDNDSRVILDPIEREFEYVEGLTIEVTGYIVDVNGDSHGKPVTITLYKNNTTVAQPKHINTNCGKFETDIDVPIITPNQEDTWKIIATYNSKTSETWLRII